MAAQLGEELQHVALSGAGRRGGARGRGPVSADAQAIGSPGGGSHRFDLWEAWWPTLSGIAQLT